jgi:hypothetical protein
MMRRPMKIAALVAAMLLAALLPARADFSANDVARFLAGMPPSAESPLTPLTRESAWQRHARFFDGAFAQLEQRQLAKIRGWSATNLVSPKPTMFYMFSGPDFLYADAFYPKATTYVLSALEPVGSVPDLTRLPRGALGNSLHDIERSLGSMLSFSFFITEHMKSDLRAGQLHGTLPILYVFLARSGKTIRDVVPVTLDDKGVLLAQATSAGKNLTQGVRIGFAGEDGVERSLYYFSTDLSNSGVKNSGFLKFCDTLAPGDSLLKSASYLLHSGNFSMARAFLLNHSAAVVQDDSGIPLGNFAPDKWQFSAFGRYKGPIDKFPGRYQPKYAEQFRQSQPIDFGIGYRWRTSETNLLLAVRQSSDGPGGVETAETRQRDRAAPSRPPHRSQVVEPGGFWWFGRPFRW